MNFKENKFSIILGVITALATGGLVFWGMKSSGKYNDALDRYDDAYSAISKMNKEDIPPTDENAMEKEGAVSDYAKSVEELQKAFDSYRHTEPVTMGARDLQNALLAARNTVVEKFKAAGTEIPDEFYLGLGRYSSSLPKDEDVPALAFQLKAFETLFSRLADAAPAQIQNVYWDFTKLNAASQPIEETPRNRNRNKRASNSEDTDKPQYKVYSIEVTFSGNEESLRKFLSSLDDTKDYFFAVRSMRVMNRKSAAPDKADAAFKDDKPRPTTPPSFDFEFSPDPTEEAAAEGEDGSPAPAPEPPTPVDSGEVLRQILGSEMIDTFLRIDVYQFLEAKELPAK